jgi:hypothetical protein
MRSITAVFIALAVVLTVPITSAAQSAPPAPSVTVPRLIHITGVFQPVDGQPPAAVEVVTLSIYAEADGGLPVWQERQSVAVDRSGRFTLLLGASDPRGIPEAVFGTGLAQWMSMLFERAGEAEQPRVRIASVPYALRASDAETLGGLPASAYALAPTEAASTRGARGSDASGTAATSEPVVTTDVVLPGTTNFLAKYVNGADVGNSAVYEAPTATVPTGAVGIGTTAPADVLHLRFTNPGGQITGLAVQNLGNTSTSYSGMLFYDQFGVLGQFQGFNNVTHEYRINNIARNGSSIFDGSINFMTGNVSRFRIAPNGSIGIGTTSPATNLDVSNALSTTVKADITASSFTGVSPFGSGFSGRKARGTSVAPTAAEAHDSLSSFGGRGYGTTGFGQDSGMHVRAAETFTASAQGTYLQFQTTPMGTTTPIPHMRLDPSGRLALGVFSPSAVVEVARQGDTANFLATAYDASGGAEAGFMTRTARGTMVAPTATQFGDELGFFATTGYGTTGFGEFAAGAGAFAAENWTDAAQGAALVFFATPLASNEAEANMVIVPGGNVGIGTFFDFPTITDKLQVSGDIRVGTTGTNGCLKNFAGTGMVGTCASDRRFKKDIAPFRPALKQLTALQPVHYFWRAADFPQQQFGNSQAYGLIAQDVEEVLPELVVTGEDGFKAVDYTKLPLLTIQAVKELKAENDTLKQRVDELEQLIKELLPAANRR